MRMLLEIGWITRWRWEIVLPSTAPSIVNKKKKKKKGGGGRRFCCLIICSDKKAAGDYTSVIPLISTGHKATTRDGGNAHDTVRINHTQFEDDPSCGCCVLLRLYLMHQPSLPLVIRLLFIVAVVWLCLTCHCLVVTRIWQPIAFQREFLLFFPPFFIWARVTDSRDEKQQQQQQKQRQVEFYLW